MWKSLTLLFYVFNFVNIRILLLLFLNILAYCRIYFFTSDLDIHQNLLLFFRLFSDFHITPCLLLNFCSLALRFFDCVAVVQAFFLSTQFGKHQNFAFALAFYFQITLQVVTLIFSAFSFANIKLAFSLSAFSLISMMEFEKAMSYFSTSNLLFRKLMFSASSLYFSSKT